VLDWTQPPSPAKRHSIPSLFDPCVLWRRSPISATAELLFMHTRLLRHGLTFDFVTELIGFPVGLIAGIILSIVVVAMVGAKLVCAVSSQYEQHRAASVASDVGSDTDDQRDILTAAADDQPRHDDDTPAPSCGQQQAAIFNVELYTKCGCVVLNLKH